MQRASRSLAFFVASFVALFFFAPPALAQLRLRPFELEGYGEVALGLRTQWLGGYVLRPAGGSTDSTIAVDGANLGGGVLGQNDLRFGVALGPLLAGVGTGVGLGGITSRRIQQVGDIWVRPSGFAMLANVNASLGFAVDAPRYRLRFEGIVGDELSAVSMERPGFPDTRVPSVNVERWFAGPRVSFERPLADGGPAWGVVIQTDVRTPLNLSLALQLTTLSL